MIDIFEHPSCKFELVFQNFSFPTLFDSYIELLLIMRMPGQTSSGRLSMA